VSVGVRQFPAGAIHTLPSGLYMSALRNLPTLRLAITLVLAHPLLAVAADSIATDESNRPPGTLDTVQVRALQDQRSSGATRTDTPLIEVPQSVRVLSQQQLDDLNAVRLADAVDYVSGVTRLNDFGGTWDNYAIRGFSNTNGGSLLNGFASSRGYGPQRDMVSVERVEFLKGPSAALYGSGEPGGTYNVVTKRPQFTAFNRVGVQGGNLGYARTTLDSTGALSDRVAYRLNLAAEDGASRSSLIDNHKYVLAPALTWKISDSTTLDYSGEMIRIRTPLDRGVININGSLGQLSTDTVLGEPGDPNLHVNADTHQLKLEHVLSADWTLRGGLSHRESSMYGYAADLLGTLASDGRTLSRRHSWRTLPARDSMLQLEAEGVLHTGEIEHRLLVGVESSRLATGMDLAYSTLANDRYAIDIYEPVYGQDYPDLTFTTSTDDTLRATGLFLQDQISLSERWKLLAGVRMDYFRQTVDNNLNGTRQNQQHHKASPRLGVTYLLSQRLSLYANASRSFRPNSGVGEDGDAFAPESGRSYELGGKWLSAQERFSASVALFDIRKNNVLTRSPTNSTFNVAAGEVRSRGVETDVAGQINQHWRVSANAAYLDTEVLEDNNAALVGKRLLNIPRVSGAVFAIREAELAQGKYGVGGGVVYVGERTGTTTDTYRLPGYTTARLTAYWQPLPRLKLTAEVHNLFDREYYTASWGSLTVIPGLGRRVVLGAQLDF
jgi:iron complex outermembrane receptor protein